MIPYSNLAASMNEEPQIMSGLAMNVFNRVLSILIIVFAVLNLTVLAIRVKSVVVDGQWGETTGTEYPPLNAIYNLLV